MLFRRKTEMPTADTAIADRKASVLPSDARHFVFDRPLLPPYPEGFETVSFGMGCFWGAERKFWQLGADSVWITAVGYAGGFTANPTYDDVCSGKTGHTEIVHVAFDPKRTPFDRLLNVFWESHDPTQGMRQGNDVGTQYRSAIFTTTDEQLRKALATRHSYNEALASRGFDEITTDIAASQTVYFAEHYHQQYLAKNPGGYCGLGGTGVSCPAPVKV